MANELRVEDRTRANWTEFLVKIQGIAPEKTVLVVESQTFGTSRVIRIQPAGSSLLREGKVSSKPSEGKCGDVSGHSG